MLGLGTSLVTQGFSDGTPPPVTLASYTSDFSAGVDSFTFSDLDVVTITGNEDSVGGEDDVLKFDFTSDVTAPEDISRANTLASGGIVAGDIIEVTFKYRIERTGSSGNNFVFNVRPGGSANSRGATVLTFLFGAWQTFNYTFENAAASSDDDFFINFGITTFSPKSGDAFYIKDLQITHKGLAR